MSVDIHSSIYLHGGYRKSLNLHFRYKKISFEIYYFQFEKKLQIKQQCVRLQGLALLILKTAVSFLQLYACYLVLTLYEGQSNENLKSAIKNIYKYLRFSFDSSS